MFIIKDNSRLDSSAEMNALLAQSGIEAGSWPLPESLSASDYQRAAKDSAISQTILETIVEPLAALKVRNGYLTEDIVCLSEETPELDALLSKFDREHHHTDDEVRLVLSGQGIFGIVPRMGDPYEIHVYPGDLLVVPAYTRHWFKLYDSDRQITAVRIFKTAEGWVALYEANPDGSLMSASV